MPHKQVAFGQPLLPGDQLHLKQQHSTARDPPGWREGEGKEPGQAWSGPGFAACPVCSQLQACDPSWRLESGTWGVHRTSRNGQTGGSDRTLPLTSTLPVCQVRGDHQLPPLSHTHAPQACVQSFDHLVGPQSCLLGGPVVMPGEEQIPRSVPFPFPQFTPHWCPPHAAEGRAPGSDGTPFSSCQWPLQCGLEGSTPLPQASPSLPLPAPYAPQRLELMEKGVLYGGLPSPGPTHLPAPGPAPDPRGEELGAVQQRAVVVVANEVPRLGGLVADLGGPGQGLDFHWVRGVMEVDDVDVKYQHS